MVEAKDYFINFDFISLSTLRAIFGVWTNICVAIIAICIRSIFRYRIKRSLLLGRRKVNLWRVSPALTPSEVFELRHVLIRALIHGNYFFVLSSLLCVVVASVGAASTVISNYSVVTNPVIRDVIVPGQNATRSINAMEGATLEVSNRVKALDRANAPVDELFDFVPDDSIHWIYKASQWNNTWKGTCRFTKHDAVELAIRSITGPYEVLFLEKHIPDWDPSEQGMVMAGFWDSIHHESDNSYTKRWGNMLFTFVSGSPPNENVTFLAKSSKLCIANFLARGIDMSVSGEIEETAFRSDIHVAECDFVNTVENDTIYQANGAGWSYVNAAQFINWMYDHEVVMNTTAKRPVIQPTGMQMLRYWQAYMSVKDSQYPNPDVRTLAVVHNMVQMRLSSLVVTVGAFLLAVTAACVAKYRGFKQKVYRIQLPSSQLDWEVQAAREHVKTKPKNENTRSRAESHNEFAIRNQDNFFMVASNFGPCITTNSELELSILDPLSSGQQSLYESEEDFDPWVGYEKIQPFPMSRS